MNTKAIIITLVIVLLGTGYLMAALLPGAPLASANFGLGLTTGLTAQKLAGGYNMANVVLFIVFIVVIAIAAYVWRGMRKTSGK